MLKFLTDWTGNKAKEIMNSRPPDFVIGPNDDPYMLRWWAIPRNRFFNIYLHHILHDNEYISDFILEQAERMRG